MSDKSFEEKLAERAAFWDAATEHDVTTAESRTRGDRWGDRLPRNLTLVECPICCALVSDEHLDEHAAWHRP